MVRNPRRAKHQKSHVILWKGAKLVSLSDVFAAALGCKDSEVEELLSLCEEAGSKREVLLVNLGYMAGYLSQEGAEKFLKKMGTVHPVFGKKMPSAEAAYKKGRRIGKKNA